MTTTVLTVLTALGAATFGGAMFAFSAFVMHALDRTPARSAVEAMQQVNLSAPRAPLVIVMTGGTVLAVRPLSYRGLPRDRGLRGLRRQHRDQGAGPLPATTLRGRGRRRSGGSSRVGGVLRSFGSAATTSAPRPPSAAHCCWWSAWLDEHVRVLVAPDKFAGTLTAVEAAQAIAEGWRRHAPDDDSTSPRWPTADPGSSTCCTRRWAATSSRSPWRARSASRRRRRCSWSATRRTSRVRGRAACT